jgi:hypothetical protein
LKKSFGRHAIEGEVVSAGHSREIDPYGRYVNDLIIVTLDDGYGNEYTFHAPKSMRDLLDAWSDAPLLEGLRVSLVGELVAYVTSPLRELGDVHHFTVRFPTKVSVGPSGSSPRPADRVVDISPFSKRGSTVIE